MEKPKKILVLGSGAIKIAEAAEFDYSGSQALKAFREEGIKTVLVNPNIATVQTSHVSADRVYLLPITKDFVEKVIEQERPDAIALGFGGQSALSTGVELYKSGILQRYNVRVIGTGVDAIERALSREKFRETMLRAGVPIPRSMSARTEEEAISAAERIGFPIMIRVSFNLGGRGSTVARNMQELKAWLKKAFAQTSVHEILLEEYLEGWKEIEYEVVRDSFDNVAVVACLEKLDPMGVHTGEGTVVTPAQTLDNFEYQSMRSAAIQVARAVGIVGECNVQFALDTKSHRFYAIETNPRMSRSSALASKATGYPLAYVSAKLALGYRLYEIQNSVSKATTAFFEPSLDYIVVKIPRWDFAKFEDVKEEIGTEMRSIGEVMGIGRNFEEAFQKAIRMLDIGELGIVNGRVYKARMNKQEIEEALRSRRSYWFLYAAKAFKEGFSVEQVERLTHVDPYFLNKIKQLVEMFEEGKKNGFKNYELLKRYGFSDDELGIGKRASKIVVKQIDTLAGEWPAKANYLYTTHDGSEDDLEFNKGKHKLLVLGAGGFRIGVSVEFDWSVVSLVNAARKYFDEVDVLNYNPETVSTDWDVSEKLYFDEVNAETVSGIAKKEGIKEVAIFGAGQIGNNIAIALKKAGLRLIGTDARSIDIAEERSKFSKLLADLGIKQPEWTVARNKKEVEEFVERSGFPVLIRPSYVLSGTRMRIANSQEELERYLRDVRSNHKGHSVVVSKFIKDSTEAELDCASDGKSIIGVTMRHIEEAGVHSGDATIVTPFESNATEKMQDIALDLAKALRIKGAFNLQFVVSKGEPYVIELNLRASRSMPFSSKSVGINLIEYAMKGIYQSFGWSGFYEPEHKSFAVKSPQFSWSQLRGAYPYLSPEMKSTGEVAAFGDSLHDALVKSWLAATPNKIPKKGVLVYGLSNVQSLSAAVENLKQYAEVYTLANAKISGAKELSMENAIGMLKSGGIDLLVTDNYMKETDYEIRRLAADLNIPLILNGRLGQEVSASFSRLSEGLTFKEMREYLFGLQKYDKD
ncbi:MAG: carbamoyl-phosphate synthase (glutamine-hydrolyzing) large subunit [Candidatus Micrarchaeia archaeon]